jgi:hypothetical protein
MRQSLPNVQIVHRRVIDLGWGHPDPALLPVAGLRLAATEALDRYGAARWRMAVSGDGAASAVA